MDNTITTKRWGFIDSIRYFKLLPKSWSRSKTSNQHFEDGNLALSNENDADGSGDDLISLEWVNAKECVHKVMIQVLPFLEEKNIDLDILLEDTVAHIDPYLIRQAMYIFFRYAVSHTSCGGHIQMNCYPVEDNRMRFELEYSGVAETVDKKVNLCLGVELVELHQGKFGTKNTKNGVCTFFEV